MEIPMNRRLVSIFDPLTFGSYTCIILATFFSMISASLAQDCRNTKSASGPGPHGYPVWKLLATTSTLLVPSQVGSLK